jgi:predicted nucleic acid-binding protein
MSIGGFSAFPSFLESSLTNFCFVDTSILFSATYPLDKFNAESETVFESLAKNNRSILTNQNVRSEFLENHRRVLLAAKDSEC